MKILVCDSRSITKKEIVFDILNKEIEDKKWSHHYPGW